MNNLNSILIEGTLTEKASFNEDGKCVLKLESRRYYKVDKDVKLETTNVFVETSGRLAEACVSEGRKGRGARVVGRIRCDGTNICVVAEHVEFRPVSNKDKGTEEALELEEGGDQG